jgi:hypothetical protein
MRAGVSQILGFRQAVGCSPQHIFNDASSPRVWGSVTNGAKQRQPCRRLENRFFGLLRFFQRHADRVHGDGVGALQILVAVDEGGPDRPDAFLE